jgi:choline dehydrogenase-like flavoprotein
VTRVERVVVIGSGASGVHFALSLLRKGHDVVMLDVGKSRPAPMLPNATLNGLKEDLEDPVEYFLGRDFEALVYPGSEGEYYGFPPNKNYIFEAPDSFDVQATGFAPLASFARGGLAETWTGGAYPLDDRDLEAFPFGYRDIEPHFSEVAGRIGVAGAPDDLARFYPVHENLHTPLELDRHSKLLLRRYEEKKATFNDRLRCFVGRSRMATLSADRGTRKACTYTGRCLWGCPTDAFYTPSLTLAECSSYENFTYLSGVYVRRLDVGPDGRISRVVADPIAGGSQVEVEGTMFALAAGTLSTSRIFLDTVARASGSAPELPGLMDNRQILVPFVNLELIGSRYEPESYQYHQLGMGIDSDGPEGYVHTQITTLKTALLHPILQNAPVDLKTAVALFRNIRAGLGVVNVNLRDTRRPQSAVSLLTSDARASTLAVRYAPPDGEKEHIRRAVSTVKKALWKLNCVVPPGMMHVRPMGASVHYAGTLPMSEHCESLTVSPTCQSHDFENLFVVDGATFPALPAKNITFTLMANAVRIAEEAF